MAVLRSRKTPPLSPPSSSKTLEKGFIEPSTPSKTTESSLNCDMSSPNCAELHSNSTTVDVPPRRRSLRLLSKLNSEETEISRNSCSSLSTKRRRNGSVITSDQICLQNVEVVNGDDSLGSILVEKSSVRVSDCDLMVTETSSDCPNEVEMKEENGHLSLPSGSKIIKTSLEVDEEVKEIDKGKAILIEGDDDIEDGGKMAEGGSSLNWEDEELESSSRRFTREEKGKGVVVVESEDDDIDLDDLVEFAANVDLNGENEMEDIVNEMDVDVRDNVVIREGIEKLKDRFKNFARRNASRFAHFNPEREGENRVEAEVEGEMPPEEPAENVEDWPGPFSTAMKIIREREKNLNCQVRDSSSVKGGFPLVSWTPRKERDLEWRKRVAPSLQSLCLNILAKNVDAITSLKYVPDALRNKLSELLCDSRKMNPHFLNLLLDGSPAELRLADCSWLEERVFEESFEACDIKHLTVLQLDLCGHCLSDSSLHKALVPKGLPALTTISLKGACRISDGGLAALVSSAPALRSINLSQCSLLTDVGIDSIANSLGSILQELYLDDCDTLDAMCILPTLKRLKYLEVLSLRGIVSVSDKFIRELISTSGQNMKELVLANCVNLTDSSLKLIAEMCSQLHVLDLSCLGKLTDIGMAHLTNGCRTIQELKLCRSPFSDDAIAAFIETSGESLRELALNHIRKVGQNTTISLARRCRNLESLDLSWCRHLPDEALGLIADSCLSLKLLKLFGCTQVSSVFVDGHSNPHLHIVGLQLTPILDHIKRPDFQQGPLHYSVVPPY
ncbi:uncharacterized protein LOC104883458 isoform X1 [Beta vulgaris subsp. vulgaris]|uniref:uncharacterized protein LOC104883458 isoform X1 n=1 Tax=Beta vulgaris subsp. vulgaris TaxID=3555 RepID=UPI0020369F27|nr:uncharacterized protein LOC104883458 isoform X1 [Beta vulgaris subsp. vulgaris]